MALFTDKGVVALGHAAVATQSLRAAGIDVDRRSRMPNEYQDRSRELLILTRVSERRTRR